MPPETDLRDQKTAALMRETVADRHPAVIVMRAVGVHHRVAMVVRVALLTVPIVEGIAVMVLQELKGVVVRHLVVTVIEEEDLQELKGVVMGINVPRVFVRIFHFVVMDATDHPCAEKVAVMVLHREPKDGVTGRRLAKVAMVMYDARGRRLAQWVAETDLRHQEQRVALMDRPLAKVVMVIEKADLMTKHVAIAARGPKVVVTDHRRDEKDLRHGAMIAVMVPRLAVIVETDSRVVGPTRVVVMRW